MGADLNEDHMAVAELDRFGNLAGHQALPLQVRGLSAEQAEARLGNVVADLVLRAKGQGKPMVIEALAFRKKKAALRELGKPRARGLSGFAFARFQAMVASRCEREGVERLRVNPAYTSTLGFAKVGGYAISPHVAAAITAPSRPRHRPEVAGGEGRDTCRQGKGQHQEGQGTMDACGGAAEARVHPAMNKFIIHRTLMLAKARASVRPGAIHLKQPLRGTTMKRITFLALLATTPALPSVYPTAAGVPEAVRRGVQEPFTRSVGYLDLELDPNYGKPEASLTGNVVLLSSRKILTSAHLLRTYQPASAIVIFHPDVAEFNQHCRDVVASGRALAEVPFHGQSVFAISAKLDLATIQYHPTLDLAIVTLNRALPSIPILPLLLNRPEALKNGYLVSYSPIYALGRQAPLHEFKRHLSVQDVMERNVPTLAGERMVFWTKEWRVPAGVALADASNKVFAPMPTDHRLTSFSEPSDSGAAFIVSQGGHPKLGGIHRGKAVVMNVEAAATFSGQTTADDGAALLSLIVPLYLAGDWIEKHK